MQPFLYLLGSCLLVGTALTLYFIKHAPLGTETAEGFVAFTGAAAPAAEATPSPTAAGRQTPAGYFGPAPSAG